MLSVLRPSFFKSSSDCAHKAVAPDRTTAANRILMAPPLRAGTCYARGAAYRNARSARLKIECGHARDSGSLALAGFSSWRRLGGARRCGRQSAPGRATHDDLPMSKVRFTEGL